MKPRLSLCVPLIALLLTACVKEPAGFKIEGGNHSLTIERNKPYFWSEGWELDLIVSRYPECQRRHRLNKAAERIRIDLYRSQPLVFILNQGKHWYVTETGTCRMEKFEAEPPEPGQYIGSFRVKDDVFGFVPEAESGSKPAGKP